MAGREVSVKELTALLDNEVRDAASQIFLFIRDELISGQAHHRIVEGDAGFFEHFFEACPKT